MTSASDPSSPGTSSLDLALVGNGTIGMLIDAAGTVVWGCVPGFDGDPVFCSLLQGGGGESRFDIELAGMMRSEQEYIRDTPILITRLFDANGGAVEVTDFAPCFERDGDIFCPMMLVRRVSAIRGKPVIRVRVNPTTGYGCNARSHSYREDTHHITYSGEPALRLTTDASPHAIIGQAEFPLSGTVSLVLGSDESLRSEVSDMTDDFLEATAAYWRRWSASLKTPRKWRDATVRAAITLKLNVSEQTGAIIAAMTTSIPEAPESGRNWDYRYCWPRDAYFVVRALARLGDLRTTERYLAWLLDRADAGDSRLKPMYRIDGGPIPDEHEAECLSGYRGMGPVRIGNAAHEQIQHDIYGEAILAAAPLFTGPKHSRSGNGELFLRLERLGENAARLYDQPDAGLWELRGTTRVHTFSSMLCWAACDRLSAYAAHLDLDDRAQYWGDRARHIREEILRRSWNVRLNSFTASMEGDSLDASLLLMAQLGFVEPDDPRFAGTVAAIERDLRHGDFVYRYVERDDFGRPENAFLVCTFWYIDALGRMGRKDEARSLFENVLAARNPHGLLAEDLDPGTLELWGNFVQTYSMAGVIDCAMDLPEP